MSQRLPDRRVVPLARMAAHVLVVAVALVFVDGCGEDVPKRTRPSDIDDGLLPGKPMTRQAVSAVKLATAAATRLSRSIAAGSPSRDDYLTLRRQVAAAQPYVRMRAQMGAEVLLGPPRSADEAGGALALLDRALALRDMASANKPIEQCVRALRLIDNELTLNQVLVDPAVRALSGAAFDLGLMLMEAYPGVPDAPDAVLADLSGTLDAIEAGVAAARQIATPEMNATAKPQYEVVATLLAKLRRVFDGVRHSHELERRADLVQLSGTLGQALRRLTQALGVASKLPYAARYPMAKNDPTGERVTALTVPAPRKDVRTGDRKAMAALGHALFRDKRLSKAAVRACIDCHQPDKAFADARATPKTLDPATPILRNTPGLLYAPLHAAQLWDGQFASAERQALKVIHAKSEMGLSREELVRVVAGIAEYEPAFSRSFTDGVTAKNIARALVAYQIRDFVPATSPMDRFARGDRSAFSDELHRGFDLFVGVARCARCHIPPLFGGSRPKDFATPVFAALGVPNTPTDKRLHADRGRGKVTEQALDEHAFKTPTVRNVARTAPYFHHGGYETLEDVVTFYEKGGGAGIGIELPNQDPDVRKLELTDAQRGALLAFMRVGLLDADP